MPARGEVPPCAPCRMQAKAWGNWREQIQVHTVRAMQVVGVRSNLWPGACAVARGSTFANMYVGWGVKHAPFVPIPPPVPAEEYPQVCQYPRAFNRILPLPIVRCAYTVPVFAVYQTRCICQLPLVSNNFKWWTSWNQKTHHSLLCQGDDTKEEGGGGGGGAGGHSRLCRTCFA